MRTRTFRDYARSLVDGAPQRLIGQDLSLADPADYATKEQGQKAESAVQGLAAGANVAIDATNPHYPVVSASPGIPPGGTTGQVLAKVSGADYAVQWEAAGAGDMLRAVYDPQGIAGDAFERSNHTGTQDAATITGLAPVATSGAYGDLSGTPVLGSAAFQEASAFATAAQGAKADSAVQPGSLGALAAKDKIAVPGDITATGTPSAATYLRGDGAWAATGALLATNNLSDLANQAAARGNLGVDILAGFRNKIINGNFDFWQRGTSLTSVTGSNYLADRWRNLSSGSTMTISRQPFTVGQTAVPGNPQYFLRTVVSSVAGAANFTIIQHKIEGVWTLAGEKSTITLYMKADAAKNIAVEVEQEFGVGGSAAVSTYVGQKALTTAFTKVQFVVNVPSIAGKVIGTGHCLNINIWLEAGSSYNARTGSLGQRSGTFDTATVSVVPGDASYEANPFAPRHIQQEEMLCQRYFRRLYEPALRGIINATGTLAARCAMPLSPVMRTAGSVSMSGAIPVYDGSTTATATAIQTNYTTSAFLEVDLGPLSGALTAGRPALTYRDTGTAYINVDAEF